MAHRCWRGARGGRAWLGGGGGGGAAGGHTAAAAAAGRGRRRPRRRARTSSQPLECRCTQRHSHSRASSLSQAAGAKIEPASAEGRMAGGGAAASEGDGAEAAVAAGSGAPPVVIIPDWDVAAAGAPPFGAPAAAELGQFGRAREESNRPFTVQRGLWCCRCGGADQHQQHQQQRSSGSSMGGVALAVSAAAAAMTVVAVLLTRGGGAGAESSGPAISAPPGSPTDEPLARARQLVGMMTLAEKARLLRGEGENVIEMGLAMAGLRVPHACGECPYGDQRHKNYDKCMTGHICGNARLHIPPVRMNDGPQGFRSAPAITHATTLVALLNVAGLLAGLLGCCCWSVGLCRACRRRRKAGRGAREEALVTKTQLLKESCWPSGAKLCNQLLRLACVLLVATAVVLMGTGIGNVTYKMPDGHATAFPAGITVAASFDRATTQLWGRTLGAEFKGLGANIMLGPGLSLARLPLNGRNFEYLSGEVSASIPSFPGAVSD